MKNKCFFSPASLRLLAWIAGVHLTSVVSGAAVTVTNVAVRDFSFSPANVAINVGDSVRWTWAAGVLSLHNTTGPGTPPLWASANTNGAGYTFTHTFNSAGSFPYVCTFHAAFFGMVGSVAVQAGANVPPTVTITAPSDGADFAAPWTGVIRAAASDPDGTVSRVDFYAGTTLLGTVQNPASNLSLGVTDLAAGTYALTAVATDNQGLTNSSPAVTVHVLTPAPITLSSMERLSPSQFQFRFSATPGLNYVIARSPTLANFLPIATNTATSTSMTFIDQDATGPINFYRLNVLPNP
ncbi:MAG TPA: Ig-like domain-containing protein [Verrucomicrobiae bacterium]